MHDPFLILMLIMSLCIITILLIITHYPLKLYIAAKRSGIKLNFNDYFSFKYEFRFYSHQIYICLIKAANAGILLHRKQLEVHRHCYGNVSDVVDGLIEAKKYNVLLNFDEACRIDLARKDLTKIIKERAFPMEFKLPFTVVQENETRVKFYCKIKYRGSIDRAIDGADFNAIIKLIVQELEGIVVTQESISLFSDHSDEVSKRLMAKSFDLISAYELLSIEIFREKDSIFA